MAAFKREREFDSSDEDMDERCWQRGRLDMNDILTFRNQKLERCNVRRGRKIKILERKIMELEAAMEELKGRVSFLEAVNADNAKENEYFRSMYYNS